MNGDKKAPRKLQPNDKGARVVKISPYPIEATVSRRDATPTAAFSAAIIRLEEFGLVCKIRGQFLKMGELFDISFELPVSDVFVDEQVRTVKTSETNEVTRRDGVDTREKIVTVEFHFKAVADINKMSIRSFLHRIGQKKILG